MMQQAGGTTTVTEIGHPAVGSGLMETTMALQSAITLTVWAIA